MRILFTLLAFNLIIIIHEMGHFVVAKLSDIKVEEFSLFLGPKIFGFKRGETTYSLRTIPIIAYVKMEGEDEESKSERSFNKKSLLTRMAVIAAGPLANIILAVILFTTVFSFKGVETTIINEVQQDSPAFHAGIEKGDKIIRYDGKRVYQPIDIFQFLHVSKGSPAEIELLRDGERVTTQLTPNVIPESESYLLGFGAEENTTVITEFASKSPIQEAGGQIGDKILQINDTPVDIVADIRSYLNVNGATSIDITVLRNDEEIILTAIPYTQSIPEHYVIGLENMRASFKIDTPSVFRNIGHAFVYTYSNVRNVGYSLIWLFTGQVAVNQMMGPVGIVATIDQVVQQSPNFLDKLLSLFNITAFISAVVGATNLIPFPALDGNKLLLLGVEAVRRKPISTEKEALISMVGFVLLITLAIYITYNDILRLISGFF